MKNIDKLIIVIAILCLFGYVLISELIPQIITNLGSSDNLLLPSNYEDMIEVKINNNIDFAVVTKTNKVVHLLFFNQDALCLYNQNIENKNITDAINEITNVLINTNNLTNNAKIELIKYENISYNSVKNAFITATSSKNIPVILTESTSTLEKKLNDLDITIDAQEYMITQLDLYSKDIINKNKQEPTKKEQLTEQQAKEYANNVYQKLTNYVITNNIVEQDKTSAALPIHLIPANTDGNIYPSINSWYYIENQKVYAYIIFDSFNSTYDFCYQGSIDAFKKGEC